MNSQQIIEDLQTQVAQLQQSEKDYHDLEFLLQDLEVRYNQVLEDKDRLQLEMNQRTEINQKTIANLKRESESLRYALHQRTNELEQLRTYKEYYQHAKDEAGQLREQLKAQFELSQRLREENEYMEAQLMDYRREYQALQENADQTFSELEEVRAELNTRQQVNDLQKEFQVRYNEVSLVSSQSESEKIRQELLMKDTQIQNYDHQLREAQQMILDFENQNLQLQNQLQRKKRGGDDSQKTQRSRDLEKLVIEKERELGDLYSALEDLKLFTTQLKRQVDQSEATQTALKQDFQSQLNHFNQQRGKLMEEVYHLHQQVQSMEREKTQYLSEIEALRRSNNDQKMTIDEQGQKLNSLRDHSELVQRQNIEILSKVDEHYKEARLLRDLLNQKDEQLDGMISENSVLQQETKERQQRLDYIEKERDQLMERTGEMDKEISELLNKYQRVDGMLNQLEEERSLRVRAQKQSELLSQEAERKEKQIELLEEKNRDYLSKMQLLETEMERCEDEVRALRRQLNSKSQIFTSNEKLQQNLVLKEREVQHLQNVNERLDSVNKQLQQECDKLAQRLQQVHSENNQLRTSREPKESVHRERESMSFHQGPSQTRLFMEGQTIRDYLDRRKVEKPVQTLATRLQQSFNQPIQSRRTSVKK